MENNIEETKDNQEIQYDATPSAGSVAEQGIAEATPDIKEAEKKIFKNIYVTVAAVVALAAVFGGLAYYYKGLAIAATVNGSPISRFEVIEKLEKFNGKKVLDSLIDRKLIEAEALKNGVVVSDEEVDGEVKNIESQVAAQGAGTLEELLTEQGMTLDDLRNEILLQKTAEKILADKIAVSDSEIEQYLKSSKTPIPADKEAEIKEQLRQQIKGQKLSQEYPLFMANLRAQAEINYYVNY
jgi:hypothetical protein